MLSRFSEYLSKYPSESSHAGIVIEQSVFEPEDIEFESLFVLPFGESEKSDSRLFGLATEDCKTELMESFAGYLRGKSVGFDYKVALFALIDFYSGWNPSYAESTTSACGLGALTTLENRRAWRRLASRGEVEKSHGIPSRFEPESAFTALYELCSEVLGRVFASNPSLRSKLRDTEIAVRILEARAAGFGLSGVSDIDIDRLTGLVAQYRIHFSSDLDSIALEGES